MKVSQRKVGQVIPSDIDALVRRISLTYTNRGQVELATQYDATSNGNVLNQIKRGYDNFAMLSSLAQDFNSAVTPGSSADHYEVQYSHARSGINNMAYGNPGSVRNTIYRANQSVASVFGTTTNPDYSRLWSVMGWLAGGWVWTGSGAWRRFGGADRPLPPRASRRP